MTQIDDPKLLLKFLVEEELDTANIVGSFDPVVATGWFNDVGKPLITVSTSEESPVGGGDTGFTYVKSDGTGGAADLSGTIQINCWADRQLTNENPKQVVWDLSEEVKRIVNETSQPAQHSFTTNQVSGDNYNFLSWRGRPPADLTEKDREAVMFRELCIVGYGYLNK